MENVRVGDRVRYMKSTYTVVLVEENDGELYAGLDCGYYILIEDLEILD